MSENYRFVLNTLSLWGAAYKLSIRGYIIDGHQPQHGKPKPIAPLIVPNIILSRVITTYSSQFMILQGMSYIPTISAACVVWEWVGQSLLS